MGLAFKKIILNTNTGRDKSSRDKAFHNIYYDFMLKEK